MCPRPVHYTLLNYASYIIFYSNAIVKATIKLLSFYSCFSIVGYNPKKHRAVNLGKGCREPNIAIHEIMHALGGYHMI